MIARYMAMIIAMPVFLACSPKDEASQGGVSIPSVQVKTETIAESEIPVATILFGENAVSEFSSSDDHEIILSDGVATIVSNVASPNPSGWTNGARIPIADALELQARGKTVRVIVTAKASVTNPSARYLIAYSTAMNGNSGWKRFGLKAEYQTLTFDYDVPAASKPANRDYIGIISDSSGAGKSMDVKEVAIQILID